MDRLRRALALENQTLEAAAAALAGFLAGTGSRGDWPLIETLIRLFTIP